MSIITLNEAKTYLRVDYTDEDDFITSSIETGEKLTADTLRKDLTDTPLNRSAVLYAVSYLFEKRETADMKELMKSLRYMLSTEREAGF